MVRLQGKRLVRALLVGLLVLLVVGGGTGFASASAEADDPRAVFAAPRPGDRASYTMAETVFDHSLADPDRALPSTTMNVEWLPERLAATPDGTVTLARPLSVTARLVARGDVYEYPSETLYDAADGSPLSRAAEWSSGVVFPTFNAPLGPAAPEVEGTSKGRIELFVDTPLGTCGFTHDHQGRVLGVGDTVLAFGGCDIDTVGEPTVFQAVEWTTLRRHEVLHLTATASETTVELFLDPNLSVPVRVVARFPEVMDDSFNEGREFTLDLQTYQAGNGEYAASTKQPPSGLVPVPLVARTPWILDDSAVLHSFPLSQAYEYAVDPLTYASGNAGESVPEFLADNPAAYLAYAWNAHAVDAQGAPHDAWGLVWADGEGGDDMIQKLVTQSPALLVTGLPFAVDGVPQTRSIADWESGIEDPEATFPPAHRVPSAVPDLAAAYALATPMLAALGQEVPNSYGLLAQCFDEDCFRSHIIVFAGHSQAPSSNVDVLLRDQRAGTDAFGLREDGQLILFVSERTESQAPVPVLPPQDAVEPRPITPQGTTSTAVWSPPPAEAVAGLSFLALLASALYYFWPALKGAVGHAGVGLFSRIEEGDVLDNPTRRRVHDAITAEPGIHFQALVRKTGLGRGNLDHHLRKLVAADLVTLRRAPGYTCFFAKGAVGRQLADAAPSLRSGGSRAVFEAVAQRPGTSSRDLAQILGMAPSTISYHVARLQKAGLVTPTAGAGVHLTPLGIQAASGVAAGPAPAGQPDSAAAA